MPELPDVEGFRRVAEHATNERIKAVLVHDSQVLRSTGPREFANELQGRLVASPKRHGKWLSLPTSDTREEDALPCLLMHFGMTGMLLWCTPDSDAHAHDRVVLRFEHGELHYRDMRKLQGIHLARKQSEVDGVLGELGPDALEISEATFRERLARTRRQLKPALMDQTVLAGLGNLCADETLWRARLNPHRNTRDLSSGELGRLYRRMRSMLQQSVRVGRVPDHRSWLTGHRDDPSGQCPRCSARLRHERVGGRSTVLCPQCQPSQD
jgi:formamidopyrimidine-DNA glycosylase